MGKELRKTLIVYGNKMVRSARTGHRYNRKSGNLDRSIEHVVSRDKIKLKFWINPKTLSKGKYNYGLIQHEGSGKGYKQSKAAKRKPSKAPKTGFGILFDHFMVRAWDKYYKSLVNSLKGDLMQAAKKVRLK